ncbi:MAG: hypothetical protein ACRD5G_14400 [Candidatus Acidiferrales bacterium]
MTTRVKAYVLIALLVVAALVFLRGYGKPNPLIAVEASQTFTPINVKDPTLQIERITRIRETDYQGSGRNIFTYERERRVAPVNPPPVVPEPPPEPPPFVDPAPVVNFKFYGLATNPATGRRRAFFTNGEDIWIVEAGQMIDRRFRLVLIGTGMAEVEEVSSRKRVSLPLEEPPQ